MEQVLVREPSTRHLYTHRLVLSRVLTLLKPLLETLGQTSENEGLEKICPARSGHSGPHESTHFHTHLLSPDPACPGLLKSKRAGGEAAGVATPDAWERLPPPCRSAPWPAGQGPGEQVRLPQLKSLCVLLLSLGFCCPVTLWGGLVRCSPCQLSTSEEPGCPSCLACALLRKLRQQSTSPRDLCLGP